MLYYLKAAEKDCDRIFDAEMVERERLYRHYPGGNYHADVSLSEAVDRIYRTVSSSLRNRHDNCVNDCRYTT